MWAAIGIGTLWSLWHLPLHFVEDSWYHGIGEGTLRFWLVDLLLVRLGVLFVWLANGSGGSILFAILAHTAVNVAAGLVPESSARDLAAFVSATVVTIAVITTTKGELAFTAGRTDSEPTGHTRRPRAGVSPPTGTVRTRVEHPPGAQ